LPLARILARDVIGSEKRERIDSEAVQRPVAIPGNEREPVCTLTFQVRAA
jgi:hypothetical protein